jgi:lantibiotic modifying enzyme
MSAPISGAHSVFKFIRRTAEQVPTGIRWQTIDHDNQPHYHYEVFNGSGGISFFLTEYYRQTGMAEALDLAVGGWRWCMSTDQERVYSRGLLTGKTGIAMAALDLWKIVKQPEYLDYCAKNARIIITENPGPFTDLMGGAASNGFYLIKLWEVTKQREYLDGAIRCAQWIEENLTRDELGCHCLARPDGEFGNLPFTGVAHGIVGVAHFFLLLSRASGDETWASVAREILATLIQHAIPDRGGLNWSPYLGMTELSRCQWSHGSPGIGLVFLLAHELLHDREYYEVALQCGVTTFAYGDFRKNVTQCIGLSGCGELFIELHRVSKDPAWLQNAHAFAEMALGYREVLPEGDAWPTDEPGLYSADFMYGASGVGHYFLRLWKPGEISMPFM